MRRILILNWFLFALVVAAGCANVNVSKEVFSGRNALRLAKANEAVAHFEAASRLDPNYVSGFVPMDIGIWTYLGRAYYEAGNKEKALESLKRAKASGANDYFARIYLGLVMSQSGAQRDGGVELEAGLKGLAVWLETLPGRLAEGRFWDPSGKLADTIATTRKMLLSERLNWQAITDNVEWLGKEFEKEILDVDRQQQRAMEDRGL